MCILGIKYFLVTTYECNYAPDYLLDWDLFLNLVCGPGMRVTTIFTWQSKFSSIWIWMWYFVARFQHAWPCENHHRRDRRRYPIALRTATSHSLGLIKVSPLHFQRKADYQRVVAKKHGCSVIRSTTYYEWEALIFTERDYVGFLKILCFLNCRGGLFCHFLLICYYKHAIVQTLRVNFTTRWQPQYSIRFWKFCPVLMHCGRKLPVAILYQQFDFRANFSEGISPMFSSIWNSLRWCVWIWWNRMIERKRRKRWPKLGFTRAGHWRIL